MLESTSYVLLTGGTIEVFVETKTIKQQQ